MAHLAPPIPRSVRASEFYSTIADGTERRSWWNYEAWIEARATVGDVMEYQFRRQFSIPVHLPRPAMKAIFLFLAEPDADEAFSGEDPWYVTPVDAIFEWPRPFQWPLPWLD